jgi:hypothetical protein
MNSQEDIKIEENKTKGKWGGRRPNSGRPKRMDEEEIIRKLQPMQEEVFTALREKIAEKDMNAIKLYLQYYLGLPTQKIENKIEGQLNQVSIEVVKPQIVKEEVMCN